MKDRQLITLDCEPFVYNGKDYMVDAEAWVESDWDPEFRCGETRVSFEDFVVNGMYDEDDEEVAVGPELERAIFIQLEGRLLDAAA